MLKHVQLCIYYLLPVCTFKHSDPECQVIACDVTNKYEEFARRFWKKAGVDHLITFRIAPGIKLGISTARPGYTYYFYNIYYMNLFIFCIFQYSASKTLDDLISDKKNGTFDFAFIDADKSNYDTYYEKCLVLMKRGGVIAFDNTLWSGKVLSDSGDTTEDTQALRKLNHKLANDVARVHVVQLNVGDGYTMAVKI